MKITHVKDQLIGLSSGEYSDYRLNGLYRCRLSLDLIALCERYIEEAPEMFEHDPKRKDVSATGFGSWLIKNGWVDEVGYSEVHLGDSWELKPRCNHLPATNETKS